MGFHSMVKLMVFICNEVCSSEIVHQRLDDHLEKQHRLRTEIWKELNRPNMFRQKNEMENSKNANDDEETEDEIMQDENDIEDPIDEVYSFLFLSFSLFPVSFLLLGVCTFSLNVFFLSFSLFFLAFSYFMSLIFTFDRTNTTTRVKGTSF